MTKNQERALAALLTSTTQKEAAEAAGIDARTIHRYMQDSEFVAEYRRAYTAMIEESTRTAQRAFTPALMTLRAICEDTKAPPMARISAARCLLDMGVKLSEMNDIMTRLEALENAYSAENRKH